MPLEFICFGFLSKLINFFFCIPKDSPSADLLQEFVGELNANAAADNITGWEDIDAGELDEFNANDYVTFIFKYYREREDKFIIDDYIKRQPHINRQMRLLLVDWMVEVQQQLEFSHEVLYLSVKLLDLYLNGRKVSIF